MLPHDSVLFEEGEGHRRIGSGDRLGQEQLQRGRTGCDRQGRRAPVDATRDGPHLRGHPVGLRRGDGGVLLGASHGPRTGAAGSCGAVDVAQIRPTLRQGAEERRPRCRGDRRGSDQADHAVLVQVQIAGGLRYRCPAFPNQLHRLKLKLAAELPSWHPHPPVSKTPYLGVHETRSSSSALAAVREKFANRSHPKFGYRR